MAKMSVRAVIVPSHVRGCLFDMDGVLTRTAELHAAAWKRLFDEFLETDASVGVDRSTFTPTDYDRYVDGRLRADGARSFLAARGITVPEGAPDDAADVESVHGLGARKDAYFHELLHRAAWRGTRPRWPSSRPPARAASEARWCRRVVTVANVLDAAGILDLFDAIIDGVVSGQLGLHGKPAPDTFLEAARRLGVAAEHTAVFEDATVGIAAGRAGGFGWVVGVDRSGERSALFGAGADVVVDDLVRGGAEPVIDPDVFTVEPWRVREDRMHLDLLAETESIFALSNGHVGVRGNLDEGEPNAVPGTYLNGFYENVPLPYAERGFGNPEEGQTLIDVTNGKVIRLLVDDEPFDIRYGTLRTHERVLDLRDGVLRREVEWLSPAGQAVRVRPTRLVSFVQRAILAIHYEVEPLEESARIVVQSALVTNEPVPVDTHDPARGRALTAPLFPRAPGEQPPRGCARAPHSVSGLRMTAAMDHQVEGPAGTVTTLEVEPDLARLSASTELEPGQQLRVVKFVAYGWSGSRTTPAVRDQVDAALAAATRTGWDGLRGRAA